MTGALSQCGAVVNAIILLHATESDPQIAPTDSIIDYLLTSAGLARIIRAFGTDETLHVWLNPQGIDASLYEVHCAQNSGDTLRGASDVLSTWLALSSSRQWGLSVTGTNTKTANLTVQIRRASDSVVLDTATIDITATVTP